MSVSYKHRNLPMSVSLKIFGSRVVALMLHEEHREEIQNLAMSRKKERVPPISAIDGWTSAQLMAVGYFGLPCNSASSFQSPQENWSCQACRTMWCCNSEERDSRSPPKPPDDVLLGELAPPSVEPNELACVLRQKDCMASKV